MGFIHSMNIYFSRFEKKVVQTFFIALESLCMCVGGKQYFKKSNKYEGTVQFDKNKRSRHFQEAKKNSCCNLLK